jgi:hypothetical protein
MKSEQYSSNQKTPTAFLCHASEDKPLARRIANDLQKSGIDTFFDEWEIRSGDSLRQKIDAGILNCTHFIALLTQHSINKSWVNAEMDAAFVNKLDGRCSFIPLRYQLTINSTPMLLRGILSPSIENYDADIKRLISDIYGITIKPTLGSAPKVIRNHRDEIDLTIAAQEILRMVIENSQFGLEMDPQIEPNQLRTVTELSDEDIIDAVEELSDIGVLLKHSAFGNGPFGFAIVSPRSEIFARFDKYYMEWTPEVDAIMLASILSSRGDNAASLSELSEQTGWQPRRLNPAISFLVNRSYIEASDEICAPPWAHTWVRGTSATRRFIRSNS